MREWWGDAIHAWRRLHAAPAFTIFSILTLALGIGATTAIYSVVYAAVLRPPYIADVERVANLYHIDPRLGASGPMQWLSRADFEDYRAAQTSFDFLAAWKRFRLPLSANGSAELVIGEAVGGDYFSVVGIGPALGRVIQPADDAVEAARVVVLSDSLWRRVFQADPKVVGRTVKLAGETFEVVGVTPPEFLGVDMPNVIPTPAWIPLAAAPVADPSEFNNRERHTLGVKGRLKPGRTMEEAQAEFRTIAGRLDLAHPIGTALDPRFRMPYNTSRPWFLMPAAHVKMHESVDAVAGPLAATILAAVGLVLLVACTNIANLMLARGTARRHETAVRLALGASRWRLMREQLVEAGLITIAGGIAALVVAEVLMARVLSAQLRLAPGVLARVAPEMNGPVAAMALAATILALIVFGLVPAIHGSRGSVRDAMASDGQHSPVPRWRGRRGLIACQVAVSAGLVSVAVLCAQQVIAAARHDSGLDVDRLAFASVSAGLLRYDEIRGRRMMDDLLEGARRLPGVQSACLSSGFPIGGLGARGGTIGLSAERMSRGFYSFIIGSPEVFATWGVSIVQGRSFDRRDTPGSELVAVVTERLAHDLFPDGPAVGRRFVVRRQRVVGEPEPPVQPLMVIGVAADTDAGRIGNRGGGLLYLPWSQQYEGFMTVSVRTASDPGGLVDPLRRLVNRVDPDLPVWDAATASALGAGDTVVLEIGAVAAGLLGGLALLLAMAGLYGVLAELVLRRTRELGIRMALGANRRQMLSMVLLDGLRPVMAGLTIGLGAGVVLRLAFRPLFLRMMPAFDPGIIVIVPAGFIAAALLAAYLPARRAARVDPNVALRHL